MELFGFQISRSDKKEQEDLKTFVPPQVDDGAVEIAPGGSYGTFVDLEGTAKSEAELVTRYREMSLQPECDTAVEDIVNEAIIMNDDAFPVELILDDLKQPASVKKRIREEFDYVLKLLDFGNKGYDIFKRWYVDGRLYHHILIDEKNPRAGIKELRYIDPRKIRKVREPVKERDPRTGAVLYKKVKEYFLYNPKGITSSNQGIKIAVDSISHATSGLTDSRNYMILSHLHKAIKPLNQLRMLEDATVIYRLARAPERRIFYIDVGNLPKMKAEQYLRDMMVKHKNRLVYDANTGEVRDDRKFMTMLEDYWLPRREGGKGTEITTLPGGQGLGDIADINYFQTKLYQALNVPVSRLQPSQGFSLGRSSEITRDEIKFNKFIERLRKRFSVLFAETLKLQLVLKGIINLEDWNTIEQDVRFDYQEDNNFAELRDTDIMMNRLNVLQQLDQYVGKYYSQEYVRRFILKQSEDEIKEIDGQIEDEREMMLKDAEFQAQHDAARSGQTQDQDDQEQPDDSEQGEQQ